MPWDEDESPTRMPVLVKQDLWGMDDSFEGVLAAIELPSFDCSTADLQRPRAEDYSGKRRETQSRRGSSLWWASNINTFNTNIVLCMTDDPVAKRPRTVTPTDDLWENDQDLEEILATRILACRILTPL